MAANTLYPNIVQIREDGNLAVPTGKSIDVESGGALKVAGTDMTTRVAALSGASLGVAYATVAAAGTTTTDAGLITSDFSLVTAADGTKGVRLPTGVAGLKIIVKNNAGSTLKVYPPTGGTINAITADGAFSMLTVTSCTFVASSASAYWSVPLVAS